MDDYVSMSDDVPSRPAKRYLSVRELLDEMLPVTRRTLQRWLARRYKPIPHFRVGRRIFFDPDRVVDWLEEHKKN